jgi:hypothetical protein
MTEKESELVEVFIDLRNAHQTAAEAIDKYLNKVGERAGFKDVEIEAKDTVSETVFSALKWEPNKGVKLGDFEIAEKNTNDLANWQRAYDVLKQSKATIMSRFHCEGFEFSYWLYAFTVDKIYRQELKQNTG